MVDKKFVAESIIGGVAITLVSYFYNSTPGLVGAVWYGFPLTWARYLLVGPQYSPWSFDFVGLIADIIIWSIVVGVVLFLIERVKSNK